MDFTVGVPTYHRPERLSALLESLLDQTRLPDEVVVVDDSTGDRTAAVIHRHQTAFDKQDVTLKYRHRTTEASMPGARNEAIQQASGDVICFLDDDVVCESTWLEHLGRTYREHPDVVAVGGPAIVVDDQREPVHDAVRENHNMNVVNRYGETREIADRWIPDESVRTDTLSGANMSFRMDALEAIGGFDVGYGGSAHWEETDVFARLPPDAPVVYHPDVFVYHFKAAAGGSRDGGSDRRGRYWYARNHVRFKWRNFSSTFSVGLLRLLVYTRYAPPPLWKHVAAAVVYRDSSRLWFLKGFAEGLYHETELFGS